MDMFMVQIQWWFPGCIFIWKLNTLYTLNVCSFLYINHPSVMWLKKKKDRHQLPSCCLNQRPAALDCSFSLSIPNQSPIPIGRYKLYPVPSTFTVTAVVLCCLDHQQQPRCRFSSVLRSSVCLQPRWSYSSLNWITQVSHLKLTDDSTAPWIKPRIFPSATRSCLGWLCLASQSHCFWHSLLPLILTGFSEVLELATYGSSSGPPRVLCPTSSPRLSPAHLSDLTLNVTSPWKPL